MSIRVGVVGLGQMGGAMLGRLRGAGIDALGFDARAERSDCAEPGGLYRVSDVVLLSLPDGAALQQAMLDDVPPMRSGQVVVDTSTTDPDLVRRVAKALSERGVDYLDAPVSGGKSGAESGTLTMLVGGKAEVLARVEPILEILTAKRLHLGPVGSAQTAKLLNNLIVATQLVALGEAARVARSSGLDIGALVEVLNESSGRSAVTEVNFPRWILNDSFDSGFSMRLMRKDVKGALAYASRLELKLPLSETAGSIWAGSSERLDDEEDFNRIVELP